MVFNDQLLSLFIIHNNIAMTVILINPAPVDRVILDLAVITTIEIQRIGIKLLYLLRVLWKSMLSQQMN